MGDPTGTTGRPAMPLVDTLLRLNGRVGRQAYWLSSLVAYIVTSLVAFVLVRGAGTAGAIPLVVVYAAVIWIAVCVSGKRLHDRGMSAWWYLIVLIPVIGQIWVLVVCGFLSGDAGANRFGTATAKTPFG